MSTVIRHFLRDDDLTPGEQAEVLELAAGQQQPQLLFSCSVANATSEVLQQRAMFTAAVAAPPEQAVSGTFKLELASRCGDEAMLLLFP